MCYSGDPHQWYVGTLARALAKDGVHEPPRAIGWGRVEKRCVVKCPCVLAPVRGQVVWRCAGIFMRRTGIQNRSSGGLLAQSAQCTELLHT